MANATETVGVAAPFATGAGPGLGDLMTVGGALLLLLGALYAGFWLLKRYGPRAGLGASRGGLKLESQLMLGPRRGVAVVRFLNKRLVLGVTDHSINLLHEVDDDDDRDGPQSFKNAMDKADTGGT